jgi:hypothetical protein
VLSLSPGPAPLDEVEHFRANAQMWRIEDDLWDNWKSGQSHVLPGGKVGTVGRARPLA